MFFCRDALALSHTVFYDIPSQSLNSALMKLAAASRLELIFTTDMVRGIRSNSVRGEMRVDQALRTMLENTGVDFRFMNERTATLVRKAQIEDPSEIPLKTLDSVTVSADAISIRDWTIDSEITDETPQSYRASHVVTATRSATPIKQIPQSIQAIKRRLMEDQQNLTVSEALYNVSGVVPRNVLASPVIEGTLIRGFRAEQLVDGFTQYYNTGDRESTVNIERIEVLKGANAIFYSGGSGSAVGGIINIVSKLPKREAFLETGFKGGSYAFYQPYFDLNQPISDRALFRVSAEYTHSASQIDVLDTERFNINPSFVFKPDHSTALTLQGKLSHWQQPEYQGLPATGALNGNFRIPPQTFIGPSDIAGSRSDNDALWVSLAHRFDEHWSIEFKGRYGSSEFLEKTQTLYNGRSFIADTPFLAPSTWGLVNAELFQRQRELAFQAYAQARFDYGICENDFTFGVDHSQLRDEGYIDVGSRLAGLVDLRDPVFAFPYHAPGPAINNQTVKNTTYGGYLQLQSTINEQIHALLGLRLSAVEIGYDNRLSQLSNKTERLKLLPRVGVAYDLSEAFTLFAGYSEGIRGQPFVSFASMPEPEI
ncbi:MAG: TonB-dependent siderophore receptor, partial [Gammaproteobacteria bacterium]